MAIGDKMPETAEELRQFINDYLRADLSNRTVFDFHRNADTDLKAESMHHTLGMRRNQSAPGDHLHDGNTGVALLGTVVLSGSKTTATATVLGQVCNALTLLGASDTTT